MRKDPEIHFKYFQLSLALPMAVTPTRPIRLGLASSFYVLLRIPNRPDRAYHRAQQASLDVIAELDDV